MGASPAATASSAATLSAGSCGPSVSSVPSKKTVLSTLDELADVIAREDPDLVLLQEVDRGARRSWYVDECAELLRSLLELLARGVVLGCLLRLVHKEPTAGFQERSSPKSAIPSPYGILTRPVSFVAAARTTDAWMPKRAKTQRNHRAFGCAISNACTSSSIERVTFGIRVTWSLHALHAPQ